VDIVFHKDTDPSYREKAIEAFAQFDKGGYVARSLPVGSLESTEQILPVKRALDEPKA
jgi:hypothetical protein